LTPLRVLYNALQAAAPSQVNQYHSSHPRWPVSLSARLLKYAMCHDAAAELDARELRERTWRESHGAGPDVDAVELAEDEALSESFEALLAAYRQPIPREFYEDYEQPND
jgi:hypothetical protein